MWEVTQWKLDHHSDIRRSFCLLFLGVGRGGVPFLSNVNSESLDDVRRFFTDVLGENQTRQKILRPTLSPGAATPVTFLQVASWLRCWGSEKRRPYPSLFSSGTTCSGSQAVWQEFSRTKLLCHPFQRSTLFLFGFYLWPSVLETDFTTDPSQLASCPRRETETRTWWALWGGAAPKRENSVSPAVSGGVRLGRTRSWRHGVWYGQYGVGAVSAGRQ